MKGKYVSALVGIGTAAMLAAPGVASASTGGQAKPEVATTVCRHVHVPWFDRGKKMWVREGYVPKTRCVLVTIHWSRHR
jgi:hypothetical protein